MLADAATSIKVRSPLLSILGLIVVLKECGRIGHETRGLERNVAGHRCLVADTTSISGLGVIVVLDKNLVNRSNNLVDSIIEQ